MVSKAREDFPEPDKPVKTISRSRGSSRLTFLRLCSRAPRTISFSSDIGLQSGSDRDWSSRYRQNGDTEFVCGGKKRRRLGSFRDGDRGIEETGRRQRLQKHHVQPGLAEEFVHPAGQVAETAPPV